MLDDEFVNQEIQEPVVVIRNNDIKKVDYQIVQSNNLVDALYTLSANELKIIFMIIGLVSMNDKDLKWYRLSTRNICDLCNIDYSNGHKTLINLKDSLMKRTFWVNEIIDGKEVISEYHWLYGIKYNNSYWYLKLHDELKPFVINLKNSFTTEKLHSVVLYKSMFSMRFSFIFTMEFKKQTSKKSLEAKLNSTIRLRYSLNELKTIFRLEDKYMQFGDFNKYVLKPSIDEVNTRNMFYVKTEKENGLHGKIEAIIFYVSLGKENSFYKELLEAIEHKLLISQKQEAIKKIPKEILTILQSKLKIEEDVIVKISKYHSDEILLALKELKNNNISKSEILSFLQKETKIKTDEDKANELWDSL